MSKYPSRKLSFRLLSMLLVLSLLVGFAELRSAWPADTAVMVRASGQETGESGSLDNYIVYNGSVDLSTLGGESAETGESAESETDRTWSDADEKAASALYSEGIIHIFHYRQLLLIGSGAELTTGDAGVDTVGTGKRMEDEDGNPVTYRSDAKYFLEGDIALPANETWTLPGDFAGEFTSEARKTEEAAEAEGEDADQGEKPAVSEATMRLYDAENDTVFIQNIYQLAVS